MSDDGGPVPPLSETYERQVRALGAAGQARLRELNVAVVGLGGTGSVVVQQLVHLGIRKFSLIDPDTIEASNLSRIPHASNEDIGELKTTVASRYIRRVAPDVEADEVADSVIRVRVARRVADADMIFSCTDSHGSRAVLQQIAYQYFVPCIDMGTTITVAKGRVSHVFGRVQLLAPGLSCLTCSGLLDPHEVRRDMMTVFERQADPYVRGVRERVPAVMSLNSTVASLAVTMVLAVVVGFPGDARHLLYNAIAGTVRSVRVEQQSDCRTCSKSGVLARGDEWPLLGRLD